MRSHPPSEELRTATLQVVVPVCIRQASFCMCDTSVWMVSFGIVNRLIGLSVKVLKVAVSYALLMLTAYPDFFNM